MWYFLEICKLVILENESSRNNKKYGEISRILEKKLYI